MKKRTIFLAFVAAFVFTAAAAPLPSLTITAHATEANDSVVISNTIVEDEDGNFWLTDADGVVDTSVTDIINTTVNGVKGWWYIKNGQVSFTTTVEQNKYGWWYVKDGMVDFSYNGFAQNQYGWWYITDGKVSFKDNSVIQGTVDNTSGWWYVKESKVSFTTTIAQNSYGWWRIENGKVNFNCNSVEKNEYGWWILQNGKVNFNYNGIAANTIGVWMLQNGKVNFKATGNYTVGGKAYTVKSGQVTSYTGLASVNSKLYYMSGGKADTSYTGFSVYGDDTWYVTNGVVDTTTGEDVLEGKVNGINSWWYVKDGKVDFSYTGLATNTYGTWYIVNGKVNFSYTGTVTIGEDTWYIKEGKVDESYNGLLYTTNGTCNVTDGKVNTSDEVTITYDNGTYYYYVNGVEDHEEEGTPIMGDTQATVDRMVAYYNSKATYPSYYAEVNSDAPTIEDFCRIYVEECEAEGVRAEVAFSQAMLETGFLKFGGQVDISQFNFAGIGALDGGAAGASFPDVRTGVRAQVQHLKGYACKDDLNQTCVDPRFKYLSDSVRGSAPIVEWLGVNENPSGTGWATAKEYGYHIINNVYCDLMGIQHN